MACTGDISLIAYGRFGVGIVDMAASEPELLFQGEGTMDCDPAVIVLSNTCEQLL